MSLSILYSLSCVVFLSPSMCVAPKLRSLHFAHPVYVASRYFQQNPPFSLKKEPDSISPHYHPGSPVCVRETLFLFSVWRILLLLKLRSLRLFAPPVCVASRQFNTNQRSLSTVQLTSLEGQAWHWQTWPGHCRCLCSVSRASLEWA